MGRAAGGDRHDLHRHLGSGRQVHGRHVLDPVTERRAVERVRVDEDVAVGVDAHHHRGAEHTVAAETEGDLRLRIAVGVGYVDLRRDLRRAGGRLRRLGRVAVAADVGAAAVRIGLEAVGRVVVGRRDVGGVGEPLRRAVLAVAGSGEEVRVEGEDRREIRRGKSEVERRRRGWERLLARAGDRREDVLDRGDRARIAVDDVSSFAGHGDRRPRRRRHPAHALAAEEAVGYRKRTGREVEIGAVERIGADDIAGEDAVLQGERAALEEHAGSSAHRVGDVAEEGAVVYGRALRGRAEVEK